MARPGNRGKGLPRRVAARRVVAGTASVAEDDTNYRGQYPTFPQALAAVESAGFARYPEMFAIVAVPRGAQRWSPRRESLADLSAAQQRRYRGSRVAQAEAAAHGLSLEQWYRVAPDVRAFRGHAPERRQRPGESVEDWHDRLVIGSRGDLETQVRWGKVDFAYYLRDTSDVPLLTANAGRKGWFTRDVRAAGQRRRRGQAESEEQYRLALDAFRDDLEDVLADAADLPGEAFDE